jgi:flagellar motility protein MotE (MotC chaperone)
MQKQILTLVIVSSVSFTLLIGGGVVVMKTMPELLGLPPLPAEVAKAAIKAAQDKELIAKREKERKEFEKRKAEEEKRKKDSVMSLVYSLTDSLNRARSEYGMAARKVNELSLEISRQQQGIIDKKDSIEKADYAQYARMYNAANPKDVAAILKSADPEKAARILKLMKNKVAAKVIESIPPEKAVIIMKLKAELAPVQEEITEIPKEGK